MSGTRAMAETFSIEFDGPAFDKHQIPAAALAQSLLALDDLAKRISDVAYGKEAEAEIKVNAVKAGSFIVELYQECTATPLAASASAVTVLTGVGYTLKKLLQLGKWALGKKVKVVEDQATNPNVTVENELGDRLQFDRCIVNIYNNNRTKTQLSRLTQTLDMEGAEAIKILAGEEDKEAATVTKEDRRYFRQEEGVVLTDNEVEVILDVLTCSVVGSPKNWRFSDGEEFTADVEDEEFLDAVKKRKIRIENGTSIRAVVRTVQYKAARTRSVKTVTEVRELIPPEE